MKQYLLLSIFAVLVISNSFAQGKKIQRPDGKTISATSIDNIVNKLMDTAEVTGLCLGIVNGNNIVYAKGYGYKNKATGGLNDTTTCFNAASLAKPLFGYIVMQLVDEGKIDLDKPLYTYLLKPLPEYENYKDLAGDSRWKLITARMCLDHTTGFPNWRELTEDTSHKLHIYFTPGEKYAYSGEGIMLLQFAVETITGRKLEDLAQEKIFKPFGMARTSFLWQPAFESDYSVGHNMNEDTLPKTRYAQAYAAGSMETTVADYTRFIAAVMQGKRLSPNTAQEIFSPQINIYSKHQFSPVNDDTTNVYRNIQLAYGLGWGLFNGPYGNAFFKEGHNFGLQHYTIAFPGKKIAFIIMANSDNAESMFKELVEKLTGVTIPWDWEGYFPYRATVKLTPAELQPFTGIYDGRLKAIVTLENGQLKVESPTVNLSKTNLYAQNSHHFFLKIMDTQIDFVKGADGKIEKAVLDDEGKHYELKKIQ